ncbi:hypothetical protein GQ43DRAFT_438159 [Delitschia confertaspora ATCC 74209]|uniref:Glutaredoxin domain-containing protein n=1 Tax=Delitschia confertaspora ATCC 74209 TaxID=1513339 RepID=A0A9P4JRS3_9PLEO|nr:hypothetical protein GQ43DRAFT_438159 [Delitschia confertaspora ATCC 74209]
MAELSVYDNDPTIYLFTSLTAGSSHIITATSRIETILKANKIPFKGVDTATDDLARKLYGRRASGKKLPLLVKEGYVVADLEQVEEWNEYGELKEALGVKAAPTMPMTGAPITGAASTSKLPSSASVKSTQLQDQKENTPTTGTQNLAMRQLSAEAAAIAASKKPTPVKISTTNPLLAEKVNTPSPRSSTDTAGKERYSPKSTPLPQSSAPITGAITENMKSLNVAAPDQKPVKSSPSNRADAANAALNSGPIAVAQETLASTSKSPHSPPVTTPGEVKQHRGSSISEASAEEIKRIEQEQAIPEVSSSEEEDSEDEDEDTESDNQKKHLKQKQEIVTKEPAKDAAKDASKGDAEPAEGKADNGIGSSSKD